MNQFAEDQRILREKFHDAADQYIKDISEDPEVDAIILTGSLVYGEINPFSDVDIYIILLPSANYRERGNVLIDGIEIEYFKNPPKQIHAYFKSESKSPHTAHMLASGDLKYSQSDIVHQLINEAKKILAAGRRLPSKTELELYKYGIDDCYKDLLGCIHATQSLTYSILFSDLVRKIVEVFYHVDGKFAPKVNWYNRSVQKDYPLLYDLIKKVTENNPSKTELDKIMILVNDKIGGGRSTPWLLRSDLEN